VKRFWYFLFSAWQRENDNKRGNKGLFEMGKIE
jgi:hypothetical protein